MFKKSESFWDVLSEILAVILVITYAVLIIDSNFNFIPAGIITNILSIIRTYGSLALIGVVGLEAIAKRNIIIQIIFVLLMVLIVIFLFFPGTYQNLIGIVK